MASGRKAVYFILGLLFAVLALPALLPASTAGVDTKNPVTFGQLSNWLGDSRPSLDMFEETMRMDVAAVRFRSTWIGRVSYLQLDNGEILRAGVTHYAFQGMFWGPLFTAAIWEVPMVIADLIFQAEGNIMAIPIGMLALSAKSKTESPMSDILRVNVMFTSDVLTLELKRMAEGLYYGSENSLIGRTYAGLSFRVLDRNSFFAGFQFLHFPHIAGWQQFASTNTGFSTNGGVNIYDSENTLLYETRAKILLYNNFLDFLQLRTLLNLGNSQTLLDTLGVGMLFRFAGGLHLDSFVSYLSALSRYSLDFKGEWEFSRELKATWKWNAAFLPFSIDGLADDVRAGIRYTAFFESSYDAPEFGFDIGGEAGAFLVSGERQFGISADLGFRFPFATAIRAGANYNMDDSMKLLPFGRESFNFFLHFEFGMDPNLSYREIFSELGDISDRMFK